MARFEGEATTVTVLSSSAGARPDGSTALLLQTRELGTIAFEVDQRAIDALRRDLTACEQVLSRKPGQA